MRELAGRIGPIPEGGEVPAIVRRQRWSPINVPLMWAAAGRRAVHTCVAVVGAVFSDAAQVHFMRVHECTGSSANRLESSSWRVQVVEY